MREKKISCYLWECRLLKPLLTESRLAVSSKTEDANSMHNPAVPFREYILEKSRETLDKYVYFLMFIIVEELKTQIVLKLEKR